MKRLQETRHTGLDNGRYQRDYLTEFGARRICKVFLRTHVRTYTRPTIDAVDRSSVLLARANYSNIMRCKLEGTGGEVATSPADTMRCDAMRWYGAAPIASGF